MSVDRGEILSEYSMYEVDLDSPEEVEVDYGYHSISKNILVNKNSDNMFTVTMYGN
jgi:hypothetical protein